MKAKILLVEGKRTDRQMFFGGLSRKGYEVSHVMNGSEALAHIEGDRPDLVIVNAASMRTSGKRICQSIRARSNGLPVVLVVDAQNAEALDREEVANVVLVLPFTLQKLINRVRPLLPVEEKNLIQAGMLQLDPTQRWVRLGTRQTRLTPRLVNLLRILMQHPNVVIEREQLFQQVWDTDYTEDTRTLDVHISWLRQAIEDDPRDPKYIKTVRGVGYRLDIP